MWEQCHYLALLAQWVKDDSLRIKCKQSQFYQNNKSRFLKLESVCWILVLLCTMNNTQHAHYKIWLCLHQSVGQNASAGQYASVYTSTYLHCEVKFYLMGRIWYGAKSSAQLLYCPVLVWFDLDYEEWYSQNPAIMFWLKNCQLFCAQYCSAGSGGQQSINKSNNYLSLFILICEFVCGFRGQERKKQKKSRDRSIRLLHNKKILHKK